jgi:hypothetical protein
MESNTESPENPPIVLNSSFKLTMMAEKPRVFECRVKLQHPKLKPIPFRFFAEKSYHDDFDDREKREVVTPFNPEDGYLIDERDFKAGERLIKLLEYGKTKLSRKSYPLADLNVCLDEEEIYDQYWCDGDSRELKPEIEEELSNLRLQLTINGLNFESMFDTDTPQLVAFNDFYPLDTGPLAHLDVKKIKNERGLPPIIYSPGVRLFLSNLSQLKSVQARFISALEPIYKPLS